MKLWDKGPAAGSGIAGTQEQIKEESALIHQFTVGNDRELDHVLAKYDVLGSLAHAEMLCSIGVLTSEEWEKLEVELKAILVEIEAGDFHIGEQFEDIHSQVEYTLTERLGDVGKKIHSGRSRNDQVLVDMHLFLKEELKEVKELVRGLFETLQRQSEAYKSVIIPGYTHLQVAMPSSFGLWFGAYAEALVDDLHFLNAALKIVDQNPLGSAAGYGNSFPLNRTLTTELLGLKDLKYNVVAAQMSRGKAEKSVAFGLAAVAGTLSRMSMDICLYMSQNFGFLTFPDHLTTGSSIMPHKKNPDVFELIRGKCNKIQALPTELTMITNNLPVGYHREFQLLKEALLPGLDSTKDCLRVAAFMLERVIIKEGFLEDEKYDYLYSVEEVNRLVLEGKTFRDAYVEVGRAIEAGNYKPDTKVNHTHEGSIGNLCNVQIKTKFEAAFEA